jgi:hypothetical protein
MLEFTIGKKNWSAAYPWNWFGSSTEVTEQGVGKLTASTPLNEPPARSPRWKNQTSSTDRPPTS